MEENKKPLAEGEEKEEAADGRDGPHPACLGLLGQPAGGGGGPHPARPWPP